ncbi:uncharacterized protein LOC144446062 isoform X2 [Glandiceps talaboti]
MGCGSSIDYEHEREREQERMTEQEIYEAFRAMDTDDSGTITYDELRAVIKRLGENLTEDDIEDMIELADTNKDDCR